MTDQPIESACDRLSHIVDDVQFERLRWARQEGPMLARLVELANGALSDRSDFELVEEGASRDEKRFILKVHGNRVAALTFSLDGQRGVADVSGIDRSRYHVMPGDRASSDFSRIDERWMAHAMSHLFGRIGMAT